MAVCRVFEDGKNISQNMYNTLDIMIYTCYNMVISIVT
jgi:hypothetical protein